MASCWSAPACTTGPSSPWSPDSGRLTLAARRRWHFRGDSALPMMLSDRDLRRSHSRGPPDGPTTIRGDDWISSSVGPAIASSRRDGVAAVAGPLLLADHGRDLLGGGTAPASADGRHRYVAGRAHAGRTRDRVV